MCIINIITSFLIVVSAIQIVQIVRRHQRQIHQQQQSVQWQVNTVNVRGKSAATFWIFAITIVIPMLWIIKWKLVLLVILIITSFLTVASALKIVQIVRRHQRQIHQQQQSVQWQVNTVNVLKFRKSALTILFAHGFSLIFYIRFCVTTIMEQVIAHTIEIKVVYGLHAKSFLNPFVYCWRIREIRQAVKNTMRGN